ncbi:tripartite tricarboxylate transporter substrate binding protein [Bradyrhizobium sp. LHD-71]|uniref:Bug family tripartite tricarboxylate transporter substrate binding protein n=1 Tax=Bradyrhizobium sp. LHD-71 TaxID=3072141 RepID=UPI00280D8BBD|nr:tripartite tricarboxylate transporter substrate binding protein [Bradyrhizobium sp. LHD-71]MDQ8732460.1 tripartite tricarboxylate transporter substrate binding protein [Bradyrhizobium sp. LHD-71]
MLNRRQFIGATAAALAAPAVGTSQAFGQDWPNRAVRIVVPFAPAGSTDITARLLANRLSEVWGQPVVVENKPGAGGNVAADLVAKSEPDGYTIFIVGPGQATNKFLYPSLTYDPVADFQPVTLLLTQPNMMCVPNNSPAKSVQEFIAHCKANPGKVTYASSGNGTTLHLSAELFKKLAGVEMQHIPYRGSGPLMNDLIPGRVDVVFDNAPSISSHVKGGAVRALGVTTLKRIAIAPELPTIDESGVKGFNVFSWFAFFVPVKTPKDVAARINADTVAALKHDSVRPRLLELGAEPVGSTADDLAKHLKSEMDKWGPVIAEARIKLDN